MKTRQFTLPSRAVFAWVLGFWLGSWDVAFGGDIDPVLVGQWPKANEDGGGMSVAVSGHYAYVADAGRLHVLDISNPANPLRVGGCDTNVAGRIVVSGANAYLAGQSNDLDGSPHGRLDVIDISDPVKPRRIGGYDTSGSANSVAVSGSYAYIPDPGVWDGTNYVGGSLEVIDISNPANPKHVSKYDASGSANGVAVSGNYAYMDTYDGVNLALQVVDISNPANPQLVGRLDGVQGALAVSGRYAYVAGWSGTAWGLQVIDISNPGNPRRIAELDLGGCCGYAVAVSGNYAFVGTHWSDVGTWPGVFIIDISNPANPQRIGSYQTGYVGGLAVSGNYVYVVNGALSVIDFSKPANPQRVGRTNTTITNFVGEAVSGNFAFVTGEDSGLLVFDISNPANPKQVGAVTTISALGVAVSGNHAYVATGGEWDAGKRVGRLEVVDISVPTNPRLVGGYVASDVAVGVAVSGNYAYVAVGASGVEVLDISNPVKPRRVGGNSAMDAFDVTVVGGRVLVGEAIHEMLLRDPEGFLLIEVRVLVGETILELLPFFKSITRTAGGLELAWESFGLARLQRATRLTNPDWQELPGSRTYEQHHPANRER